MAVIRRKIKDSIFTFLFQQPEYTLELYKMLHPEDQTIRASDLQIVTLENVLVTGFYNDFGLMARDTLMILTEAQSIFSWNMPLRMAIYLADTCHRYAMQNHLDLYSEKAGTIPRPELYVVYTGDKRDVPSVLLLSDLYADKDGAIGAEVTVQVLRDRGTSDILDQYVQFCKIADEQRKIYGYTLKAVQETIRICMELCMERSILVTFLGTRQVEVQDIMMMLYDEEYINRMHEENLIRETQAMSETNATLKNIKGLMKTMGWSAIQALQSMMVPETEQDKYLKLLSME